MIHKKNPPIIVQFHKMIPPKPPHILVAARGPEGPFQNGLRQALLGGRIQLLGNAHAQPIAKVAKVEQLPWLPWATMRLLLADANETIN